MLVILKKKRLLLISRMSTGAKPIELEHTQGAQSSSKRRV